MIKQGVVWKVVILALNILLVGYLIFTAFCTATDDKSLIFYWILYPVVILLNVIAWGILLMLKKGLSEFVLKIIYALLIGFIPIGIISGLFL